MGEKKLLRGEELKQALREQGYEIKPESEREKGWGATWGKIALRGTKGERDLALDDLRSSISKLTNGYGLAALPSGVTGPSWWPDFIPFPGSMQEVENDLKKLKGLEVGARISTYHDDAGNIYDPRMEELVERLNNGIFWNKADRQGAVDKLAEAGRFGDSIVAHLNPEEAALLTARRGAPPSINPETGLPEFFSFDDPSFGNWAAQFGTQNGTGSNQEPDYGWILGNSPPPPPPAPPSTATASTPTGNFFSNVMTGEPDFSNYDWSNFDWSTLSSSAPITDPKTGGPDPVPKVEEKAIAPTPPAGPGTSATATSTTTTTTPTATAPPAPPVTEPPAPPQKPEDQQLGAVNSAWGVFHKSKGGDAGIKEEDLGSWEQQLFGVYDDSTDVDWLNGQLVHHQGRLADPVYGKSAGRLVERLRSRIAKVKADKEYGALSPQPQFLRYLTSGEGQAALSSMFSPRVGTPSAGPVSRGLESPLNARPTAQQLEGMTLDQIRPLYPELSDGKLVMMFPHLQAQLGVGFRPNSQAQGMGWGRRRGGRGLGSWAGMVSAPRPYDAARMQERRGFGAGISV